MESYLCFKGSADELFSSLHFKSLCNGGTNAVDHIPLCRECVVSANIELIRHLVEEDALLVVSCAVGHMLPDLFSCEGKDRSDHSCNSAEDNIHCALCASSFGRLLACAVKSVLDDIKVEVGHFRYAEIVDSVNGNVEIESVISCLYLVDKGIETDNRPLVDLLHICGSYHILVGIEAVAVADVAENISCSVSDLLIGIRKLLEDILGNSDIGVVIGGSYPQTENICAVLLDNVLRVDTVAEGLVHCSALAVNYPAVCADCLVRSLSCCCNGGEQ